MNKRIQLSEYSPMITDERSSGNSNRISLRKYPSGDVEVTSLALNADESLGKGGGAPRRNTERSQMSDRSLQDSLKRASITMRRRILSINASRMLTLTFRQNITDPLIAWGRFKYFMKLVQAGKSPFLYVAVMEFQKRGAIHFHLAVNRKLDYKYIRTLWYRAVGNIDVQSEDGSIKSLPNGNIDVRNPNRCGFNSWNPRRLAGYLTKYLKKSFNDSTEFNKRRYSSSKNIPVPQPVVGWACFGSDMQLVLHELVCKMCPSDGVYLHEFKNYWHGYFAVNINDK